jgi:hypothetical protein
MPAVYNLVEMSKENLAGVVAAWKSDIEGNIPEDLIDVAESSYDRLFGWMEKSLDTKDAVGHGFFILQSKPDNQSPAIVEMVDARAGKDPAFKFLNIYFAPNLNLEFKDEPGSEDLADIKQVLITAFSESTNHAISKGSKFKMYGRTQEIAKLFEAMMINTDQVNSSFTVIRQSRWLVIESA